jgi:HTH-type transcriptional regulator/antitoxin HigA
MPDTIGPGAVYLELIRRFPLRPIRSDADLAAAIAMVDELAGRESLLAEEEDYLEVLSRLIEAYEAETDPIPAMSAVEALRYLLGENGLTQAQLANETGLAVATLSEILNGKRGISAKVRAVLAERFRVSPSLFVD